MPRAWGLRGCIFYTEVRNITLGWQKKKKKQLISRSQRVERDRHWQCNEADKGRLINSVSLVRYSHSIQNCDDWKCSALSVSQQAWLHAVSSSGNVGCLLTLALLLLTWVCTARELLGIWRNGDHRNGCSAKWEWGLTNLKLLIRDQGNGRPATRPSEKSVTFSFPVPPSDPPPRRMFRAKWKLQV